MLEAEWPSGASARRQSDADGGIAGDHLRSYTDPEQEWLPATGGGISRRPPAVRTRPGEGRAACHRRRERPGPTCGPIRGTRAGEPQAQGHRDHLQSKLVQSA